MEKRQLDVKKIDDFYLRAHFNIIETYNESKEIIKETITTFKEMLLNLDNYMKDFYPALNQKHLDKGMEIIENLIEMNFDGDDYFHEFMNLFSDIFIHNKLGYLVPFSCLDPTIRKIMCAVNVRMLESYNTIGKICIFLDKDMTKNDAILGMVDRSQIETFTRKNIINLTKEENEEVLHEG